MANLDDRRAKRSRKMLKQGLLELMREKKFSVISIKDITERMDLNRGTFYLHYPNTTALLQSVEKDLIDEAAVIIKEHLQKFGEDKSLSGLFSPLFDYVVVHKLEFETLLANDTTSYFIQRFKDLIQEFGNDILRIKYKDIPDDKLDYLLGFVGYGLIGLIKFWFDSDLKLSKEVILSDSEKLVEGAAEKYLCSE